MAPNHDDAQHSAAAAFLSAAPQRRLPVMGKTAAMPSTRSDSQERQPEPGMARWARDGLLELKDVEAQPLSRPGQGESSEIWGGPASSGDLSRLASWASALVLRFISYPPPGSLRLRRTSWLDGVRGVAALAVYIFHAMGCWASIVPAWHADKDQTSIFQLPLIRTIFVAGGGAVSVFFVLSGYVLTYRCLRLIRAGAAHDVYPAVASSMFRRGFRLYLPPVLLTFCEMLMTRLGFAPPLNFTFVPEPSFAAQFVDWVVETNKLVNPLHNFPRAIRGLVTHPKYDPVIWTIPVEFWGSMVCYALLVSLARVPSSRLRMGCVALFAVLGMALGGWNIFCFAGGMLLADYTLGQEESLTPTTTTDLTVPTTPIPTPRPLLWSTTLFLALYTAGFPTLVYPESRTNPMPGFATLRALIPARLFTTMDDPARVWWSLSGIALLLSLSQLPRTVRAAVFESRACQYLARISFALYLVHEFCIVLFGLRLQGWLVSLVGGTGSKGSLGYWVVCVVWFGVFTVPVFALAAQVERWVDVPSVRFAKWLEERCLRVWKGVR